MNYRQAQDWGICLSSLRTFQNTQNYWLGMIRKYKSGKQDVCRSWCVFADLIQICKMPQFPPAENTNCLASQLSNIYLNVFIIHSKHRCLNPRIDFKIISLGFMSKLDYNPFEDLVPSIKYKIVPIWSIQNCLNLVNKLFQSGQYLDIYLKCFLSQRQLITGSTHNCACIVIHIWYVDSIDVLASVYNGHMAPYAPTPRPPPQRPNLAR